MSNIWGILSSAQVQSFCTNYSNSIFLFWTHRMKKYTADSPRIRPYRHKILSNSPNGLHSAYRWCVVITKIYCFVITLNSSYSLVLFCFHHVVMAGSDTWNTVIFAQLDLTWIVETESCVSWFCLFYFFLA